MICVSRFFDRASGHSVFVLSNCCVEQTPPLGQSDKCRDRLASTSLSNLLNHTPHSQAHLSLPQSSHLPTFALPLYLKLTFIERCPGLFKVSLVSNYWYFPNLWISTMKLQAKTFSGRLYLVFFKWNWTELLNFCQLELFPPLLNHLKTTCFPLVFPPVTGVLFSNVQAVMLCNTKQNFALKNPNTITSYFSLSSVLLGLTLQTYSQLIFFFLLSWSHYSLTKTCLLVPLCVLFSSPDIKWISIFYFCNL